MEMHSCLRRSIQLHVVYERWEGLHNGGTELTPSKPGGLWTSTELERRRSRWTDTCPEGRIRVEQFSWPPAAMIRLENIGNPRIAVLRNAEDPEELLEISSTRSGLMFAVQAVSQILRHRSGKSATANPDGSCRFDEIKSDRSYPER